MSYSSYNHGFNYPYRRPAKMEYGMKRVPDYTEMAYKEAVGKLRYFLTGNYSPSIRSYGGSASIKNLDESDADLDKKYTPYSALGEYSKPRPRLTTKYATLYADSLNKYRAPVSTYVPPATTTPSDTPNAANPDVINFIQKQEEYIEQLERESQYCRDELNSLLGKVKEVISENEHLHETQKNKLISRMFHTYNAASDTDDVDDVGDSTGLDSDHKVTPSKTKKPGMYRPTKLEGPNIVFESRIAELEAHLSQAKIDLKKVQEENNENKRKLASGIVDSTCLDGFKRQIDNLQRDKTSLESQIVKLRLSLDSREGDLEGRYKRNDGAEQQIREERNNLEAELRRMKEDLAKERNKVRELASEGSRRAIQERSAAEQRYNAHFDDLSHDLAAQYDNVSKLQLEIDRQRRDENDLKREISMKNAAVDELKMELKTKTSSLQTDLAQAHAEKASLDEELASARLAIERHQRQTKHETNRFNSEIQSLRQRLDRADADLVHSRRENLRLSEQLASLEKELNMKNLSPMSPEKTNKEKEFSSMIDNMENKHARTVAELETMIHSQNSLMEKLTGDCRMLTDKLDDANRRHKEELATLHRQVELLGQTMRASTPDTRYQAPPTLATTAHGTAEHPPDSRPDHPRIDATGHAQISRQPSNASLGDHRVHSNSQSKAMSRQPSKTSIKLENNETLLKKYNEELTENIAVNDKPKEYEAVENPMETGLYEQNYDQNQYVTGNMEYQNQGNERQGFGEANQGYTETQGYTEGQQDYAENQQDYPEGQQGYTESQQGYTDGQQGYTEGQQVYTEGQQGYTEGQQRYTEGQEGYADGIYEQYPEQQYVDPNAQYEDQYGNHAADPNYQTENYGNQDYTTNQEYAQQPQEVILKNGNIESKRSNSPNEKVTNKS